MKSNWIRAHAFTATLNWTKVYNYFLLTGSFYLSKWSGTPKMRGLPAVLSIEPTTSCNLRCPECPSGLRSFTRPTGMIDTDLFKQVIRENNKHILFLHVYFQGEPYLHPKFTELIRYADSLGIYTSTSTNAHYLNDENIEKTLNSGLKELIVSMDGMTQQTYENYRIGGSLPKVMEGVCKLLKRRSERKRNFPQIILQFLVTGNNEHEILTLQKWAKQVGIDKVELKSIQVYNFEGGSPLIPKSTIYSRYLKSENGFRLKKEIKNKCWRMWQGAVVTWDGKVVPCCFDKDASHQMGNIKQEKLSVIWKKPNYQNFRRQLLYNRKEIEMCRNCSE